jgi:hypothetical protein
VAWDYLQYVLGLEELGFEVTYLEDAGLAGYEPVERCYTEDLAGGVAFLQSTLADNAAGIAGSGRWHVRGPDGQTWGMDPSALIETVAGADVFLNVSGMCLLREEYLESRCKVLIDTDPGWNHFVVFPRHDAGMLWPGTSGFRAHDRFFTYAARTGRPGCQLPDLGLQWEALLPPVVTSRWTARPAGRRWTTVLTWDNYAGVVEHCGRRYGSKGPELARIEDLPALTGLELELAVGGVDPPVERWQSRGWSVVDGPSASRTADSYRGYVSGSRGECSVAKQIYTATGSGWFSSRSVCYLAAGRPAVLQDTGWSEGLPNGRGLLSFDDAEGATRALRTVERDYERHAVAAREMAEEHFAASVVLGRLLDRVGA